MKKKIFTSLLTIAIVALSMPYLNAQNTILKSIKSNSVVSQPKISGTEKYVSSTAPSIQKSVLATEEDEAIYFEDFESITSIDPTAIGFTIVGDLFSLGQLINERGPINGSSGKYYLLALPKEGEIPNGNWAITKGLELTAGINYEFETYVLAPGLGETVTDEFKIAFGTAANAESMTTTIFDYTGSKAERFTWKRLRATFTVPADGTYYFGFHFATSVTGGNAIGFDDIKIDTAATENDLSVSFSVPQGIYTQVPANLAIERTDSAIVAITNIGMNNLTNVVSNLTVKKNSSEIVNESSLPVDIAYDNNPAGSKYEVQIDAPTSSTPDTYEFTATITTDEGLEKSFTTTKSGGAISESLIARDNGDGIGTYGFTNNGYGMFGQLFPALKDEANIKSVTFMLNNSTASGNSMIAVFEFTGTSLTLVGISDEFPLVPSTGVKGYTQSIYTYAGENSPLNGTQLTLNPVDHVVGIYQPTGPRLGLIYTSNADDLNYISMSNPNNEGWSFIGTNPFAIRLNVGQLEETSVPTIVAENLNVYTSDKAIIVNGCEGMVSIYSVSGQLVESRLVNNTAKFDVNEGLYIVRAGEKAAKVIVK